jgi:hypothetical protein
MRMVTSCSPLQTVLLDLVFLESVETSVARGLHSSTQPLVEHLAFKPPPETNRRVLAFQCQRERVHAEHAVQIGQGYVGKKTITHDSN